MSRFVVIYLVVAALAVIAALMTLALAPPAIAPVAVSTAALSTITLALAVRSALMDRADLRADIHEGFFGISDNALIEVRMYNAGRRPIRVEEMGFGITKPREFKFQMWNNWSRDKSPEIPFSLSESDSVRVWTWPGSVARWLVRHAPPTWLYAKDHTGRTHWFKLPPVVVKAIQDEWPKALEGYAADLAKEEAAKRGEVDDYNQPIQAPELAP